MIELDTIYNEDCLTGMQRIPDGSVDCIICDLPYGTTRNAWDSVIPLDKLWEQYRRVIKRNGAIVLFSQQPFTSILIASNLEMFKYEWIWEKESGTGHLNANFAPMKVHENIAVFSKAAACYVKDPADAMTYNPQYKKGKPYHSKAINPAKSSNYDMNWQNSYETHQDGEHYRPTDIIFAQRDDNKYHPTQKPVDLLRYLILTYSNEGDTILDNTIGSGTTAVAALREKRHFIGFELNRDYYDIALRRIKLEQQQQTLF